MGELTLGRKLGWKGMAWGLLFGTLPDLDIIASPFLDHAERLRWHRGISHSIFMMVVAALVFAKPLSWLHREKGVSVRRAGWFVFFVWSTHVLIDVFTTYGTQIFEPFSDTRVAWNNLFIIDFFFTVPLLVGLLYRPWKAMCHGWERWQWRREGEDPEEEPEISESSLRPAKMAILLSSLYVSLSLVMKFWATHQMTTRMEEAVPGGNLVAVTPTPLNTILWRGLIETEAGYFVTHWSPFDDGPAGYQYLAKNHELAEKFEGKELFEALAWFSRGHWVARPLPDGRVTFIDVRFGEVRDFENRQLLPMFQWQMGYDDNGHMEAPAYRPKNFEVNKSLGAIWKRILGNRKEWEEVRAF